MQTTSSTNSWVFTLLKNPDSTSQSCQLCRGFEMRSIEGAVDKEKIDEMVDRAYPELNDKGLKALLLHHQWKFVRIPVDDSGVVFHHCEQGSFVLENLEKYTPYVIHGDLKDLLEVCACLDKDLVNSVFESLMNKKGIILVRSVKSEEGIAKKNEAEKKRLRTFYNQNGMLKCANFKDQLSPEEMAKAGFEYIGKFRESYPEDTVYCMFGDHFVAEFESSEIPLNEHIKHGLDGCPWVAHYLGEPRIGGENADNYGIYDIYLTQDTASSAVLNKSAVTELNKKQTKEIAKLAMICLFEKHAKNLESTLLSSCPPDTTIRNLCNEVVKFFLARSGCIVDFLFEHAFDEKTLTEFTNLQERMTLRLDDAACKGSEYHQAKIESVQELFKDRFAL